LIDNPRGPGPAKPGSAEWTHDEWVACLEKSASRLAELPDRERRHLDLIEAAEARTHAPRAVLELAYEIAEEEGIDPALGLELIICRVAVEELTPPEPPADEAHSLVPEFVEPLPASDEEVMRERRMRMTFRRVRGMLEKSPSFAQAIHAFADEPDIGQFDYYPAQR